MSIVIEDGSIVSGANSYATEAEFAAFYAARAVTLSGTYTAEQLLILAMDYIESQRYKGIKRTRDQLLQWPRVDVYIDGYYFDSDDIPVELKKAQMQAALAIDASNSPQQNAPRKTIREKVGDLEVQYSEGSAAVVIDVKIMSFLYKLLESGFNGNNVRVGKA